MYRRPQYWFNSRSWRPVNLFGDGYLFEHLNMDNQHLFIWKLRKWTWRTNIYLEEYETLKMDNNNQSLFIWVNKTRLEQEEIYYGQLNRGNRSNLFKTELWNQPIYEEPKSNLLLEDEMSNQFDVGWCCPFRPPPHLPRQ